MAKIPLFKSYLWEQIFLADTFLEEITKNRNRIVTDSTNVYQ